jgi:hypothetical protein
LRPSEKYRQTPEQKAEDKKIDKKLDDLVGKRIALRLKDLRRLLNEITRDVDALDEAWESDREVVGGSVDATHHLLEGVAQAVRMLRNGEQRIRELDQIEKKKAKKKAKAKKS